MLGLELALPLAPARGAVRDRAYSRAGGGVP